MKTYKKEDDEILFPFQTIDKMQVVQEAKSAFNESSVNSRKCVFMITKILYLLGQGDTFNTTTATDLFFAATKLFISEDPKLRRMLYLLLKELSPFSEQTFVAINSLSKDMSSKNEEFKANAIRTLRKITDQSMVNALDRHFKQAVVDQSASVASAALVAGNRISDFNIELVKRWSNEVQSTVKSTHNMVQYHALALLYKLKKTDPLAVTKLISTNTSSFRSPLAHSLLIKYATKILREENSAVGERSKTILKYLDSCLTYKNEIIIFEAAKALCSLDYLSPKELTSAVTALQTFLSYSKPVYKFAAIRILNKLANKYPILASIGNSDMETLISDPNRNIATLAITTLLKTGNESNIDKLMKQISSFMSDIPDEFKIVVVDAMRALALQYPHKYQIMLNFLASSLREEGGYEFKKAIVDTIITVLDKIPESKEHGLSQLCEFIEDCEYTLLLQQVLHYLGNEGPKSQNPSRCIRYIYNRVILESAPVRASAVVSLARFAAKVPALRQSIKVILKRTMQDNDDEVRDRAVFFLRILEQENEEQIKKLIIDESSVDLATVEKAINIYVQHADFGNSFDITKAAEIKQANGEAKQAKKQETTTTSAEKSSSTSSKSTQIALLQKIPELAAYGTPFKVARATNLSEQDADYVVSCVKHIYKDHIVFQFIVTNKVETQKLRNVKVTMDLDSVEGISEDFLVQPGPISFDSSDSVFVSTSRTANKYVTGKIPCVLKFVVDTVDPESGEIEEQGEEDDEVDYDLEDLKLSMSDYIADKNVASFKELWETLGEAKEIGTATKENGKDNIQSTVDKLIIRSGLTPLNERKVPAKKTSHTLYFAGELTGEEVVLFAVQISTEEGSGATLKYAVRSQSEDARKRVLENLIKK